MSQKSIYKDSGTTIQGILIFVGLAIIGVCIYLTSHYFATKYPIGIQSASVCDFNSFFNCDAATYSPISNLFGVPISLFGLLMGVLILAGFMFQSEKYEGSLNVILKVNVLGCVALFIYSLVALGTLCPFCTVYYILSIIAFYLFHRHSEFSAIDVKSFSIIGVVYLVLFASTYAYVDSKNSNLAKLKTDLIRQYNNLADLGVPEGSKFRIASATENFADAPIQISKFSDFQCPACKALSGHLAKVAKKYKGKVNIQYFFYPLDPACNPNMGRALHPQACNASYLAYCLPEKFKEIEHLIFENQKDLSLGWIKEKVEKYGVKDCFEDPKTKEAVTEMIKGASVFNIRSTPTFLVNGKKIEGVLPLNQLYMILDEVLEKNKK